MQFNVVAVAGVTNGSALSLQARDGDVERGIDNIREYRVRLKELEREHEHNNDSSADGVVFTYSHRSHDILPPPLIRPDDESSCSLSSSEADDESNSSSVIYLGGRGGRRRCVDAIG